MKSDVNRNSVGAGEFERALQDFPAHAPPSALFRLSGSHGLKTLVDGTLRISPPCEFNDPFEFAPGIDPDLKTTPPVVDEIRRHFLAPYGLPREALILKWANGDETKYRQIVEKTIVSRPDVLPSHLQGMRQAMTKAISAAYGVICFSALSFDELGTPAAVRQWSTYADDHRGLAIEFDGTHAFFAVPAEAKWLFPVEYLDTRRFASLADFEDGRDAALLRNLRLWATHKSGEAWSHEREWRVIAPLSDSTLIPVIRTVVADRIFYFRRLWDSNPSNDAGRVIRRVVLGCRVSSPLETSVRAALRAAHLSHVELWRAKEDTARFSFEFIREN